MSGAPAAALIGGGFIGPVHVEALRRIGVEVVGLLGSSFDRATQTARRLAIPRVYRDLDELLDDRRVGVVHVASPNGHHFEQARRVLESGRHVVCEKPLATSARETAVLRALADSRPAQAAAVNYNVRYYPLCHEIRERIASGALGRVLSVTGSYVQDWLLYPDDYNWRVERDGGTNLRAVADIGTHWMDLAQFLIGCADPGRVRRSGHVSPAPAASQRGHRTRLAGRARRVARRTCTRSMSRPTITPPSFLSLKAERARGISRFPGDRRPEEPSDDRDRRHWRGRVLGQRIAQPSLARLARDANQVLERDPALLGPVGRRNQPLSGRPLPRGFPTRSSNSSWTSTAGSSPAEKRGSPRSFPTFSDGHREVCLCEAIAASATAERWVTVTTDSIRPQVPNRRRVADSPGEDHS